MLTKQETLLGRAPGRARGGEPRRTALPYGFSLEFMVVGLVFQVVSEQSF